MKDFKSIKHFYFLGIGGIGMSALARYFKVKGGTVAGYDKTKTSLTLDLDAEGIPVHYEDDVTNLPLFLAGEDLQSDVMIVYTPAIPKDNREFNHLKSLGYRLWKRSEVLGFITSGAKTIAVAGTHGKTTTSTMIAHVLKHSGVNCTAFLGGISKNYNTNLLLPQSEKGNEVIVVEADEYDRSFLTLFPELAVITSIDADHLDIYGNHDVMVNSYREFASQVKPEGTLVIKSELPLRGIAKNTISYSIDSDSDFTAKNIRIENGCYLFDVYQGKKVFRNITLTWPGRHNVENAVACVAICSLFGLTEQQIKTGLNTFQGVKRRFDYQYKSENIVFIDDYAHHPQELQAAIGSVRELYPGKRILGIFQPHLYSRTKDFAVEFGSSLSLLDELILLDIYPARELPIEGVNAELILGYVSINNKKVCSKNSLNDEVLKSDADIIITLGAGDIDQLVGPLKASLEKKFKNQNA